MTNHNRTLFPLTVGGRQCVDTQDLDMQTPLTNTDGAEASRSSICARCQQPNVSITVRNEYLCQYMHSYDRLKGTA